ncbi:unnamed protein product, partial [Hapterophycus canaliculatus]
MKAGMFGGMGGMSDAMDSGESFDDSGMMGMDSGMMGIDEGMDGMDGMDDEFGMGGGRPGRPGKPIEIQAPEAQLVDPAVSERMKELTGMVAEQLAEGFSSRITSGRFGAALTDVAEENEKQGYMVGGESVPRAERLMWVPGIIFIGEGASREMTELAAMEEVELLIYIVVSVKKSRTDEVQNICRAKIIDCKTGKTLVASGGMDNREVKRLLATKRGTADGHVTEQLETFWRIVDTRLALMPLPALSPAIAMKRVTQLMSEPSYSKVRKLAEVRLFNQKGWLTDDELEQAFEI